MEELLKELLEETKPFDGEEEILAELKGDKVSANDVSTVQAALRLFGSLADKITKSKSVRKKLGVEVKDPPKIDAKSTAEFLKNAKPEVRAEIAKGAGIDETRFAEVFAPAKPLAGSILKSDGTLDLEKIPADLRPAMELLFKDSTDTKVALKKAEEDIKKNEKEKKQAVWLKKAEEFKDLPGVDCADLANTLMKMDDEDAEKLMKQFRANMESIEKGGLFSEHGRSGGGHAAGTTIEKVNLMAKALIQKDDKMDEPTAIQQVLRDNPTLYAEYVKETQIRA